MVCSVCKALVADVRRTCLCLESTETGQASSRYRKIKAAEAEKTQKDLDWARIQMGLLEADRDRLILENAKVQRRVEDSTNEPLPEQSWAQHCSRAGVGGGEEGKGHQRDLARSKCRADSSLCISRTKCSADASAGQFAATHEKKKCMRP